MINTLALNVKTATVSTYQILKSSKLTWIGTIIFAIVTLMAIFAPYLTPYDPISQDPLAVLQEPSALHWMGTDSYGRDVWTRMLYGARISLFISVVAVVAAMIIGGALGIVAGYYGGRVDMMIMRVMDIMLSFPTLIMGLIVVAMLGASMTNLVIAIALTVIPKFARVARAPTLSVKKREYIEACYALGYSDIRIMVFHILPNVFGEVLVIGSLWIATAIRIEASLSFIGLGIKPPTPTWGGIIREGFNNFLDAPWIATYAGLAVLVVVFSLNLIGDGVRDAVDPKLRGE